jgi:MoaA/NifB/PqqE/SkfB family radical SAM enzyme
MLLPIHYKCNQRCVFCSANVATNKEEIDIRDLITEIKNNFKKGDLLGVSGGEPFLTPALLVQVINEASNRGLFIELLTNATLITTNKKIVNLISDKIEIFNIDFPAHNEIIDFKITKTKGAFKLRNEGVKYLLEKGLPVRLTHIVNKLNYKYLVEFSNFVVKNYPKIKYVQFSFVKGMGAAKNNKQIVPRYGEVSPFLEKAFGVLKNNKIEFVFDHIPICFLNSFKENSVDYLKIKNNISGEYSAEKEKIKECLVCELRDHCPGPRKDYIDLYKEMK